MLRPISPAMEGEALAMHLSSIITFMEYEMHSLIIAKLRCVAHAPRGFLFSCKVFVCSYRGHNCAFGVSISFNVTSSHCMVFATGTSMVCPALPLLPPLLFESGGKVAEDEAMLSLLDKLTRTSQVMAAIAAAITRAPLLSLACISSLTPHSWPRKCTP